MTIIEIPILIGAGLLAGAWNAVAGGATLLTFPVLMAVGLPPIMANATNFLALSPANLFALPPYLPELRQIGRRLIPILAIAGAGAAVGSVLLIHSDPTVFEALIPVLLLIATVLFASGDWCRVRLLALAGEAGSARIVHVALFLVSIYGGYFGAGAGVILLALGQLLGYSDFHVANAIKNATATFFMLISIVLFGIGGLIAWPQALLMMGGAALGGYFGGRMAKGIDPRVLRTGVTAFGLVLTVVYGVRVLS